MNLQVWNQKQTEKQAFHTMKDLMLSSLKSVSICSSSCTSPAFSWPSGSSAGFFLTGSSSRCQRILQHSFSPALGLAWLHLAPAGCYWSWKAAAPGCLSLLSVPPFAKLENHGWMAGTMDLSAGSLCHPEGDSQAVFLVELSSLS